MKRSWYGSTFSPLSSLSLLDLLTGVVLLLQVDSPFPNLNEVNFYMEQAGLGLGRMEMQRIFLAVKQLAQSEQLPQCRLWGKILGTESNYVIAEAAYKEGEEDEEQKPEELPEEEEAPAEDQEEEKEVPALECVCVEGRSAVLFTLTTTFVPCLALLDGAAAPLHL